MQGLRSLRRSLSEGLSLPLKQSEPKGLLPCRAGKSGGLHLMYGLWRDVSRRLYYRLS